MPISGVNQDAPCVVIPKGQPGDICILTLTVTGNKVPKGGISGGPKLCQANEDGTNPNQCYQPNQNDGLNIAVEDVAQFTVTASGDPHVTPSPTSQTVDYNQTGTIALTVAPGYTAAIASDTCGGSLSGNTYTTGAVTSNCSVSFSGVAVFPVAEGPSNVVAVPGNGQVTISWTVPTNTGTGVISGYTVTYGPTSGTTFTTAGCTTSLTSCTVSGLTNGTAYTFSVTTTTTLSGANETGPASFSSSVTPIAGLAVSPSTLALSSLASSHRARIITLTNNSNSPITLTAVPTTYPDFSPSLPSDITISSTCNTSTLLAANGGSCTVTITPGTTASSNSSSQACTNGTAPETSVFNVTTSPAVAINAVVLGYGCQ